MITSLVNDGGQNPIEPAKFGCKIFHGPNIDNFKENEGIQGGAKGGNEGEDWILKNAPDES